MRKHNTVKSHEGIVEFGYDSNQQMYIELCNQCTMVMRYSESNEVDVQLYKNGNSVDRHSLSSEDLYIIDNILEDWKEDC
jgi:hypothetical protein